MKRTALSIVAGVSVFAALSAVPKTAAARCCDSFWSCVGAVATAGASCAVEAAVDEIQAFVQRVERTRDEGKRQMEQTTAELDREAASACGVEHRETTRAHAEVLIAKALAQAAINRGGAKPADVTRTLQAAQGRLDALERETLAGKNRSTEQSRRASAAREAKIRALNTTFHAAFVAPLTGLIAPLIASLDPISAVAAIATIASQMENIERETSRLMGQGVDQFEGAMRDFTVALRREKVMQKANADEAKELAQLVKQLAETPSEERRKVVDVKLNAKAKAPVLPALATLKFAAVQGSKAKVLPAIKQHLIADAQIARAVKPVETPRFDRQVAERTTQSEFDKRLNGKTGKALEQEKQALLKEARAYFRKDRKHLATIEKAIADEVKKREKLAPPRVILKNPPLVKPIPRPLKPMK